MEQISRYLVLVVVCFAVGVNSLEPLAELQNNQFIDSHNFSVKWAGSDAEWLTMEMSAPAKGYVAIGFSPTGSMADSDFVMGWVDADGKVQLKDLYGVGNTKPKEDTVQDVELLGGEQTDEGTTIRFRRKWNTGDKEHDREIGTEEVIVVWAFNDQDPKLADVDGVFRPPYHFANRGSKKFVLRTAPEAPKYRIEENKKTEVAWTNDQFIDSSKFSFKWAGQDPEWLTMEIHAPAKGYVSVGFSPTGSMKDSDFVMGWVDENGKAYLKDLYGVGNTKPKEDTTQDVELLSGFEDENGTTIRFRRKWTTGDKEHDMELNSGDVIVLWAFNDKDPAVADDDGIFRPPYHFANRGGKTFQLRSAAPAAKYRIVESSDVKTEKWWTHEKYVESSQFSFKWAGQDSDWLEMEISAPAKGYVSVGVSPTGSMKDGDFVMGWVDDSGKVHLKDLYGVGNTKPKEDTVQDVELISGVETEKGTTIRFRRKWNTGDEEHDINLETDSESVIVLWAYNDKDPVPADEDGVFRPPYHFKTRGAQNYNLRSANGTLEAMEDMPESEMETTTFLPPTTM